MKIVKKMSNLFVSTLKKMQKLNPVIQVVFYAIIFLAAKFVIETFLGGNIFSEGFTGQGKEMVLFHMNGCGHCKKFSPIWDDFSSNYKGSLKLKKLEREEAGDDMLKKYEVQGFPTILLLDEQGNKKEFQGDRTISGLESFATQ